MRSYRVWEHGSPKAMKIDTLPALSPGAGEVVVAVKAAGVGFVDTLMVSGRYQTIPPLPFTPGMEFAGIIRAVGPGVIDHVPGDRVAAYVLNGAFAEQALAKTHQIFPLPDAIPFSQAALLCLPYLTAHFALVERGRFKRGETVLVGGAGGAVGLAAVQIAKVLGARVLGAVRSEEDAAIVSAAGADAIIDLTGPDLRDAVRRQVHAATDGKGADIVIDPIGGEFLAAALRASAWGGRLVIVGFAAGDIPTVKVNDLLLKNISILGLELNQYRDRSPDLVKTVQAEVFEMWGQGLLQPRIARRFEFEAVPDALEFVANGRTNGRAIVSLGSETL